jgi:predicted  nucleic acid-binding Zn-ribbon protein
MLKVSSRVLKKTSGMLNMHPLKGKEVNGAVLDTLSALIRLQELEFKTDFATKAEKRKVEAEINRCKAEVDPDVLEKYEVLKQRYGQTAIARLERNICSGCYISVPLSNLTALAEDVFVCEHCGRLLYKPDDTYYEAGIA